MIDETTMAKAVFIVRVMDSLRQYDWQNDDDVNAERIKLKELYDKHGRFSEGSERGRAEWLIGYLREHPLEANHET